MKFIPVFMSWGLLAQGAPPSAMELLTIYGPLGIICGWLMWRDERRDKTLREINEKQVNALGSVAHKMNGLSRALIFNAATHAPTGIKELAQKELAEMERKASQE